jgi:hypothetical protein
MLVYRFEHPDTGQGPYQFDGEGADELDDMRWSHQDFEHMAPWMDDRLGGIDSYEVCGCDSPESLLAWFDGWIDELAEVGFMISVRYTEAARLGENGQVVFPDYGAHEVESIEPHAFAALHGKA